MTNEKPSGAWSAIEEAPEKALNMRLRSELMTRISDRVNGWGGTQSEAARRLGITQPRLSDLQSGRINKFSLDALVNLTLLAQFRIDLNIEEEDAAVAG